MATTLERLARENRGLGDTIYTLGKNAAMQPVAGLAGLMEFLRGGDLNQAVSRINNTQALAGGPVTAEGGRNLKALADAIERVTAPLKAGVDTVGEASPLAGAALAGMGAVIDPTKVGGRAVRLTGALRPAQAIAGNTSRELRALQRAELTSQQRDLLGLYAQRYPDFGAAAKFMTPQELGKALASEGNVRQIDRLLTTLPTSAEMAAMAKAGAPKQGWYRASTQALVDVFGPEDAPRFASLLAALSPQTSVEMNLVNTLNTWKNWTAAGRPTDERSIRAILGSSVAGSKGEGSVLEAWAQNANRALSATDPTKVTLSGPKVDSFYRNLADDVYRVTNDAWMANAFGVDQGLFSGSPTALQIARGDPGLSPGYIATSARVREGGQRAGMLPSETQETIWSMAMPLYESQARLGMPAREILDRGLLTPDVIRGTPDFSTLLNQGDNARILRAAGYGDQLDALRPFDWQDPKVNLSSSEQRAVDQLAARLEQLRSDRAAESRAISVPVAAEKPPSNVFAYATPEYIPGRGVNHLEGLVDEAFGTRQNFSSRAAGAFKDLAGRDVLRDAVGLRSLQTRNMTGAFRPDGTVPFVGGRNPMEVNPGFAIGSEVPVVGGLNPTIPRRIQDQLTAVEAVRGAMTAQHGSPWNAQIPYAKGESRFVPMDSKVDPDRMGMTAALTNGEFALADTGAGTAVINWGKSMPDTDAKTIADWLGSNQQPVPTRNVSDYVDYSSDWLGPQGSGAVTRRMLGYVDKLPGNKQAGLDAAVRQPANALYDLYSNVGRTRNELTRNDLMLLLDIMRKRGITGVRDALNSGAALPAAAGAMIAPALLSSQEDRD